MAKVTGKNVIEYFEANREYFPSKFTVDTVKHYILNSDYTPAEILAKMEAKIERIRAKRLAKAQEQAIEEEAAKAQDLIDAEVVDPVEIQNKQAVSRIIREIDLNNKCAFFKFARGSKA